MTRVALIGLPTDVNSSYLRGAAKAPALVRAMLETESGNEATELGGALGREIDLVDHGDLALADTLEQGAADDALIEAAVSAAIRDGATPLLVGGDHAVTYPIVKAIAAHHGPVSILHIDAHSDLYDSFAGNRRSHASPFARIMEEGLARRLVQVGIRTLNDHPRAQAARFGVEIAPMRRFNADCVALPPPPLYVSIDLDGLDPSCAPGVSHREPGGLSVREVLDLLARIDGPIVGGDVVEYNPDCDIMGLTCGVAAKLVRELAALAAR